MTFSALDSALLGPLFATDAMRDCFSDRARVAAMLQAEAALARAEAGLGLVPDGLAAAIEAVPPDGFDLDALGRDTAVSGVPTMWCRCQLRFCCLVAGEPLMNTTGDISA